MAIVINNTKRVIILNDETKSVRILSGGCEVPTEQWLRVRKHLEGRIGPGKDFEEKKSESRGKDGKESFTTFNELPPEEAEALVQRTLDVDVLEKWKKSCKTDSVRIAITNRISEMKER